MIGPGSDSNPLASIPTELGIASFNRAAIPSAVRDGDAQAKQAYVEGLAFEQVLVNQLSTALTHGSALGGAGGSSGAGSAGGPPADDAYASMFPQALTGAVMASGGLGVASEIAQALDPSLMSGARSAPAGTGASGRGSAASPAEGGAGVEPR